MNKSGKPVIGGHRTEEAQQEAAKKKAAEEAAQKKAEEEAAQKKAIKNIGSPGMVGVGPGASLQQKTLQGVQKDFKTVLDQLKKPHPPDEGTIKQFIHHLTGLSSDVAKLKGAVPTLEQKYNTTMSSLHNAEAASKAKNAQKVDQELVKAKTNLQGIVDAKIG